MTRLGAKFKRLTALVLALICMLSCMGGPAHATATPTDTSAGDEGGNRSYYKMSSVASAFFADALAKKDGNVDWSAVGRAGNIGAFLGYSDEADQSGIITGWIMSALSSSSATFAYSSFRDDGTGDIPEAVSKNLFAYVNYGRALGAAGFDKTGTETTNIMRLVSGLLMKGVFYLSMSVEWLFSGIVDVLKTFNPFRFIDPGEGYRIADVTFNDDGSYSVGGQIDYATESENPGIKELGKFLSNMYKTIQDSGAVIMITLFFAILVISLVLGNDKNAPHKVLVFVRRLLIICLGVPIIGSFYTTMLNALGTDLSLSGSQAGSTRILLSTFMDFETWAKTLRLGIPSSGTRLVFDGASNMLDATTVTGLRDTCYWINAKSWSDAGRWQTGFGSSTSPTTMPTNGKDSLEKFNGTAALESDLDADSIASVSGQLNELLDRYMNGSFYYASNWASDRRVDPSVDYVVKSTGTVTEFRDSFTTMFDSGPAGTSNANPWSNGGSLGSKTGKDINLGVGRYMYDVSNADGLSDLSMYNYLTSKFGSSSVIVYSSEKASSGFVRESHYSVNLIGTNILESGLYFFDAFFLLAVSAIIGWCYGVSLLIAAIRRSIMVIMDIPFVAVGSLKSAARVLLQVVMTLVEIVGTILAYVVVTEILMSLSSLLLPVWTKAADGWGTGSTILNTFGMTAMSPFSNEVVTVPMASGILSVVHLIILAINIVVKVAFMIMALKLRKNIIKSLDEQAKGLIDKLFGVDAGPTGNEGPGLGSRLAAAGAAGAGAALGHKLMGGGSSDGKVKGTAKAESGKDSGGGTGGDGQSGNADESSESESHDTQAGEAVEGGEQSALPYGGGDDGAEFGDGSNSDHVDENTRQSIDEADSLDSVNVGGGSADGGAPGAGDGSSHEAEADGGDGNGAQGDGSGDDDEPGGIDAAGDDAADRPDGEAPDGAEAAEAGAIAAGAAAAEDEPDDKNPGSDGSSGSKAGESEGPDRQADGEGRGTKAGDEAGSGSGGDVQKDGKDDMDSEAGRPAEAGDAAGSGELDGSESSDASGKSGHDSGTGGSGDAAKPGGSSPKAVKPGDAKTDGSGKSGDKPGKSGTQSDGKASDGQGPGKPGEGGSVKSAQAGDGQTGKAGQQVGGKGKADGSGARAFGNGKPGESGGTGSKAGSPSGTAKPVAGADDKPGAPGKSGGKPAGNQSGAGQSGGSKPADSADISQAQTRRAAAEAAYAEALAAAGGSEAGIESGGNEPGGIGTGPATKNPAADGGFEAGGNAVQDGGTAGAQGPDAADGAENARGGSGDAKSGQPGKDDGVRGAQATPNGKGPQGQGGAAGRSAPVEGTIDGQPAHGTVTRNADGSATVSMRKDGQGPSAEVPIAGAEQVGGAGVSNGTGQSDGGRKSSAGKAAVAAAVASFMASSDNQVIAAAGQGLGQAANAQMAAEAYRRNDSGGSQASDQGTAYTSGPQGQKGATQSQGQKGAAQSQGQKGTTHPQGKGGRAPTQQPGGGITNGANQNAGRPAPRHAADITTQAELDAFNQETAELEAKTQALLERQKKDGTRKQRPSGGKASDKADGQAKPEGEADGKREKGGTGKPGKKQPLKPKKLKKDK